MKKKLLSYLVILIPLAAWVGCEAYHIKTSSAKGLSNYSEYRGKMREPQTVRVLKKGDLEYVACYGPVTRFALVSGPPVYVFDLSGNMVDWSADIGDDGDYYEKWRPLEDRIISIREADALLGEGHTIPDSP